MVGVIDVVSPERAVHDAHVLHRYVARVGYVDQPWTLCVLVGAFAVPLAPYPELLPVVVAVAVDGAVAGDGKAVDMVGVDQCRKVVAGLALNTCLDNLEVGYPVGAFQFSALCDMQVRTGLEEQ